MSEFEYLGNKDLLNLPKTAFLASNTISSETVLRCYDWATKMSHQGQCVVSGFSSKLEKDVLHFLLKGKSPIIIVLARRMYVKLPEEWRDRINDGRMLVVATSPAVRQSRQTAAIRNHYIADICEKIYLACVSERSSLHCFIQEYPGKCVEIGFDMKEE